MIQAAFDTSIMVYLVEMAGIEPDIRGVEGNKG